ncbi:hypothetical protein BTJ68_14230 [Hortaea werneckii EXF-2000]|nr:hypothetical protein BTJ68_14230 [Hortaea werneckii EXF-2000]RMZ15818.1 hypothetical protein D0860_01428 [Hortaea werneckii]
MAEDFVELGATGIGHLTDKYFDQGYDRVQDYRKRRKSKRENRPYRYQLPSPERDPDFDTHSRRADSLERESLTSERVLRAYENEPDDPRRKVDPRVEEKRRRDSARMSYYNGYADERPRSQPPRSRYYDDEDSDYDEREGRRHRGRGGYGYDDRNVEERDTPYGREIVETERYRGPPRPYDPRRLDSYQTRDYNAPYAAGAVAPYRRSHNDLTEVSRRPKSRGRSDRYERDRSRSRSSSRSRSKEGWREKLDETFDTRWQGVGVGVAGAVVGGLAAREFGGERHRNRDALIGAVVGGLGANAAEQQWREWQERRRDRKERDEDRYLERPYDSGRSRSHYR